MNPEPQYRFEVAISFAGDDKRDFVRQVAEQLQARLGDGKVFFDEWFEAEIAGPDAHLVLQNYYCKRSRLVVSCVCQRYDEKPWTQDEWRAIQAFERTLRDADTNNVKRMRFLPLRFGDGEIEGLFSTAIVPDVRDRTPAEVAELILKRLDHARQADTSSATTEAGARRSSSRRSEDDTNRHHGSSFNRVNHASSLPPNRWEMGYLATSTAVAALSTISVVIANVSPASMLTWGLTGALTLVVSLSWNRWTTWYARMSSGLFLIAAAIAALPSMNARLTLTTHAQSAALVNGSPSIALAFLGFGAVYLALDSRRRVEPDSSPQRRRPARFIDDTLSHSSQTNLSATNSSQDVAVATDVAHSFIELTIHDDFDDWTPDSEANVLNAIKALLQTDNDVKIVRRRRGSVKLLLKLTPEEAERLYWAARAGDLAHVGVIEAEHCDEVEDYLNREASEDGDDLEPTEIDDHDYDPGRDQPRDEAYPQGLGRFSQALKRGFDLVLSAILCVVLLPVALMIACLIKMSSPGPVIFGRKCRGQGGREITVWKFRTMVCNAEQVLAAYLNQNPEARSEWNSSTKLRKDPRVTSLGRFLRGTHLDELPCLANVLLGEMSLVGPPLSAFTPPIATTDTELHGLYQRLLPGVFWFPEVDFPPKTRSLHFRAIARYLLHWSMSLDIYLIMCNVPRLLLGRDR